MPDETNVDADKFDRILSRMLIAKPLSKADRSERIKAKREGNRAYALEMKRKNQEYRPKNSKKLGQ
jgi:hypothetical protein